MRACAKPLPSFLNMTICDAVVTVVVVIAATLRLQYEDDYEHEF